MRFTKPMVIVGILVGVLGAMGLAFVFSPLYLDLMISLRGADSKNEYVIVLSEGNNSRGMWALDLPKDRYTERTRPGFSEIFAGWFIGKPIRMPTYDKTDINLDVGDFSFVSAAEHSAHKQDRGYWAKRLVNLRVEGKFTKYDSPLWYRPEVIAKRFELAAVSPAGTTVYQIKPDVAAKERKQKVGCKSNPEICAGPNDETWLLAIHGSNKNPNGVVTCSLLKYANSGSKTDSSCKGEFVFPNKRHVWFDAPYMEKEKVRDFYDRVWEKLKDLTVYNN